MADKVYITPHGARQLRDELNELWRVTRPEVTKNVSDAAALGDRSENADYIYGKKRLREIDSRVRFLRKRLDELIVVHEPPTDKSKVYFGGHVTLEDCKGHCVQWQIVGPDEFDIGRGKLSCDSPLGRALLGKAVDTEIDVESPAGRQHWVIIEVSYDPDKLGHS